MTEVHRRILANLGFKFRSHFTAHCGRRAARRVACGRIISRHASQCYGLLFSFTSPAVSFSTATGGIGSKMDEKSLGSQLPPPSSEYIRSSDTEYYALASCQNAHQSTDWQKPQTPILGRKPLHPISPTIKLSASPPAGGGRNEKKEVSVGFKRRRTEPAAF